MTWAVVWPNVQIPRGGITSGRENSTWLTWQEVSVSLKPERQASASGRPPRSTSPCQLWATSSLLWWTAGPSSSPTGTRSWPGCCRTLWEETPGPWWSPASHLQEATMRRAWARCDTPTEPRASRTDHESTKTPRRLWFGGTRRRSGSWGPSSSWTLETPHVSNTCSD